ncbi:OB-fold domain-containing protein [Candidatus Daviesbacteria bacterium]|nr:OB-fold domain-containing protein [Candidatus Daviesbacteria bacterium]
MNSPVTVWRHHKQINKNLNKTGRLLVWTKVFVAPSGFEHEAPYFVAIVELEDGQKMPLQLVDCEEKDLKIGRQVMTVVRKRGKVGLDEVIEYGIKAKLI